MQVQNTCLTGWKKAAAYGSRYGMVLLGNFMITLGLGQVVLANGFIAGGVTGLGLILQHMFPVDIAVLTGVINTALFLAGAALLGRSFFVSTALSALVFPFFLKFCMTFTLFAELGEDLLLASVLGGAAIGAGIGLIIRSGGSTGGVDVVSLLLHRYLGVPVSKAMACIDVAIILLQLVWQQNTGVLYGILTVLVTSYVLNQTLAYGDVKVQVLVFSPRYAAIRDAVLYDCDTGVTMLSVETGYAREAQQAVLTVVPYKSLILVKEAIRKVDPGAFVVISTVREVGGRGYSIAR